MSDFDTKIKCWSCNKNKSKGLFSKTAVTRHQESRRLNARNPKVPVRNINCMACNAGNRDELQCSMCSRTMGLEKFNKAQRKQNDNALCLDCSQEKLDREADFSKEVQEIIIYNEEKNKLEMSQRSINALSERLSSARLSSGQRSRLKPYDNRLETETNPASDDPAYGNDAVSLSSSRSSSYTSANKPIRPTTGTAWDRFPGDNRATTASVTGSRAGFAKAKANPIDPKDKIRAQIAREQKRTEEQEELVRDESDESDDDENPY